MKLKFFNLIEIALALGILGIGLTSVVALFPLGFQEIRDSIGENYSSISADSMFAFLAMEAYSDWNTFSDIPTSKPVVPDSSTIASNTWSNPVDGENGSIYDLGTHEDGIYGIRITSDNGNIIDFSGEVLLWKSKVQDIRAAAGENITELSYNEAMVLHLEMSWPTEKPYGAREKNTFYFELFNYNQ